MTTCHHNYRQFLDKFIIFNTSAQKTTRAAPFSGTALASEFLIKRSSDRYLGDLHINCVHSFFSALGVERYRIAFANVVDETGYVNEDFFFRRVVNDKTKSFGFVEELYSSCVHNRKIKKLLWRLAGTKVSFSW